MSAKSRSHGKSVWKIFSPKIWISLCSILIISVFFLTPYRVAKDSEKISGIYIEYCGNQIHYFDESAVKDFLAEIQCRKSFNRHYTSAGLVEINFIYDNRPIRIVLGENNFCYHSADDFLIGLVINAESVLTQFESLLQNN